MKQSLIGETVEFIQNNLITYGIIFEDVNRYVVVSFESITCKTKSTKIYVFYSRSNFKIVEEKEELSELKKAVLKLNFLKYDSPGKFNLRYPATIQDFEWMIQNNFDENNFIFMLYKRHNIFGRGIYKFYF